MTASQKKVARLLLDDLPRIALLSAKEVGALTGTSETTVIRFSATLGYSGYGMLQKAVQNAVLQERKRYNPISKLGTSATHEPSDAAAYLDHAVRRNHEDIERTLNQLGPAMLEQAVGRIWAASSIVVIGLRASYAPAHWLSYTLNILRGNAMLYHGSIEDGNYLLSRLGPDSLVIALSFPRYMRETYEFVREAKARSAQIIAITDDGLSPLALLADQLLQVEAEQPTTLRGMSSVFALLYALTGFMAVTDQERVQHRLAEEQAASEQSFYFVKSGIEGDGQWES